MKHRQTCLAFKVQYVEQTAPHTEKRREKKGRHVYAWHSVSVSRTVTLLGEKTGHRQCTSLVSLMLYHVMSAASYLQMPVFVCCRVVNCHEHHRRVRVPRSDLQFNVSAQTTSQIAPAPVNQRASPCPPCQSPALRQALPPDLLAGLTSPWPFVALQPPS